MSNFSSKARTLGVCVVLGVCAISILRISSTLRSYVDIQSTARTSLKEILRDSSAPSIKEGYQEDTAIDNFTQLCKDHDGSNNSQAELFQYLFENHGKVLHFGEAGREIMDKMIFDLAQKQQFVTVMEIGVWFGHSIARWLNVAPNVRAIGIDPFTAPAKGHRTIVTLEESYQKHFGRVGFNKALAHYLIEKKAANATGRYALLTGLYPAAAHPILIERKVVVDVLYIDGGKTDDPVAHCEFITKVIAGIVAAMPNIIVSGDDWIWKGPSESFQNCVKNASRVSKRDLYVAKNRTWIMSNNLTNDVKDISQKVL